jgi:Viral BACON domain
MKKKLFFVLLILCISLFAFADDTIFSENFSGVYPGAWAIGSYLDHGYSYGWAWVNGYAHEYTDPATGAQYYYHNDFDTYMQRTNLDLTGYTTARLSFNCIVDTEEGYDFFEVWVKDSEDVWYRMLGESGPHDLTWIYKSIDLSAFAGQSGITIEFYFYSDSTIGGSDGDYAGVFLDGITLTAGPSQELDVTAPNGGENWSVNSSHLIKWITPNNVDNVKIQVSTNNRSTWSTVINSTPNDGQYSWSIPNTQSSQCFIKISDTTNSSLFDESDAAFSITPPVASASIRVVSPNGGESLEAGTTYNITWTSSGSVGKVNIGYSIDNGSSWSTIAFSVSNSGSYNWTIPNATSSQCLVQVSSTGNSSLNDVSNNVFTIAEPNIPPEMVLSRTSFNFGADTGGTVTTPQTILVSNGGGGNLNWSASSNANWINVSPSSGAGSSVVTISVNPVGQSVGVHSRTIIFTADNAANSPQTVDVFLDICRVGADDKPFGSFGTPQDGSTVRSSIAVTGWALDDIEVEAVEIWRKTWTKDSGGDGFWKHDYIGNALMVDGARPDVEQAYPGYPLNYKAGWGYMLLTNFLPNQGNGTFVIYPKVIDKNGHKVILGEKTIHCDNVNAVKPFGAIDTPAAGGVASGSGYRNQGWVLTPMPNSIPTDGSTIDVMIDGMTLGNPTYNIFRSDIASFFPGYANSNGALAYFDFNTISLANGVHTIQWVATDSGNNTDGIGSRYFNIQNVGGNDTSVSRRRSQSTGNFLYKTIEKLPVVMTDAVEPVLLRKGLNSNLVAQEVTPGDNGIIHFDSRELEYIKIHFPTNTGNSRLTGYQVIGLQLRPLPIGSTLDKTNRFFYWQPGPGFVGEYRLLFVDEEQQVLKKVNIRILPKYSTQD